MASLGTLAAAVAGTAAVGAYVDARLHLSKDLHQLYTYLGTQKKLERAATQGKVDLWQLWLDQVERIPNESCIWSREGEYTFAESHLMILRYANWFLQKGVKPGEKVAVYLQNCPEFMFIWLSLWSIGCIPALVNYNLGGNALLHCVKISESKFMIVDYEYEDRTKEWGDAVRNDLGMEIVILSPQLKEEISRFPTVEPSKALRSKVTYADNMALMYTSGTTGLPKGLGFGVARTWTIALTRMGTFGMKQQPNGDRWYCCMPVYHGTGGLVAITCMLGGITLCLGKRFSTSMFWNDCRDSNATAIVYVGEVARYLLAADPTPDDKKHNVRLMYGNGLRPDVWAAFQERFGVPEVAEFFNSTEGVFQLINYSRGEYFKAAVGHHGAIMRMYFRNTYVPVEIDSETGDVVRDPKTGFAIRKPYEEGGEMIVAVPDRNVFPGYYKNTGATSKKFLENVFKNGDLYYRSGDALRRTSDGHWHFIDRLGDTFRWKSENVSTAEVGEVLGRYPGVTDANVYGVLVPKHDGRAGCAAILIAPEERKRFDYDGLLAWARQQLPKYAVPVFLRIVESASLNHSHKQNKVQLRNEGIDLTKIVGNDKILWLTGGRGKPEKYVEFKQSDYDALNAGSSKL